MNSSSPEEENRQGDGVELSVVEARGAERRGVIWVLGCSLAAAVVVVVGYWLLNYGHFNHLPFHQS